MVTWEGEKLSDLEYSMIAQAFDRLNGNIQQTARALGISRANLYRKLKELGLYPRKSGVSYEQTLKAAVSARAKTEGPSEVEPE
jgi:Zn-dependent peptidase ImmA (M78 family)